MESAKLPILRELIDAVRRLRNQSPPIWLPKEVKVIESVRQTLNAIPISSPLETLFRAISFCYPHDAGMVELICSSRPTEPVVSVHHVPDSFNHRRAQIIEQDPAIPLSLAFGAGFAACDVDVLSDHQFFQSPYSQALYPHYGLGGVTGLGVTVRQNIFDETHVNLWLFREKRSSSPGPRACRMLEAVRTEICTSITKMRIPILPHKTIDYQILSEKNDGYVLLRRDGSMFEANRRAFVLSDLYCSSGNRYHQKEVLTEFLRPEDSLRQEHSTRYFRRADGMAILEVSIVYLASSTHEIPENLILVRMSEVPIYSELGESGARLLGTLPVRLQYIAHLLVATQLSAKELARKTGTSYRTVETQIRQIYMRLSVRSRFELRRLLTKA